MARLHGIDYAQVRMQSRYGQRADAGLWLKLHNIHDLGGYLQTAQQSGLRQWVLGLSASYNSHEIELALRQKLRSHILEVAGWVPVEWRQPLRWVVLLPDLPALQLLLSESDIPHWIRVDPAFHDYVADEPSLRQQQMRDAGLDELVDSWREGASLFTGWYRELHKRLPASAKYDRGMRQVEKVLLQIMRDQLQTASPLQQGDYDNIDEMLGHLFRRHAFEPAGVFAYLAVVGLDVYRVRSDLMERMYFMNHGVASEVA